MFCSDGDVNDNDCMQPVVVCGVPRTGVTLPSGSSLLVHCCVGCPMMMCVGFWSIFMGGTCHLIPISEYLKQEVGFNEGEMHPDSLF